MIKIMTYFTALILLPTVAFGFVKSGFSHHSDIYFIAFGFAILVFILVLVIGIGYATHCSVLLSNDVSSLKDDSKELSKQVNKLERTISSVQDTIYQIAGKHSPAQNKSPTQLTDYGRKISDKIDADELVRKYVENVIIPDNANAYRIQAACFTYANNDLMDDATLEEQNKIEEYAFHTGDPISFAFTVVGIKMRDHILKRMNMLVDDVDNHTG
jgi:hypothetical protein